jgi:hypothetical protein
MRKYSMLFASLTPLFLAAASHASGPLHRSPHEYKNPVKAPAATQDKISANRFKPLLDAKAMPLHPSAFQDIRAVSGDLRWAVDMKSRDSAGPIKWRPTLLDLKNGFVSQLPFDSRGRSIFIHGDYAYGLSDRVEGILRVRLGSAGTEQFADLSEIPGGYHDLRAEPQEGKLLSVASEEAVLVYDIASKAKVSEFKLPPSREPFLDYRISPDGLSAVVKVGDMLAIYRKTSPGQAPTEIQRHIRANLGDDFSVDWKKGEITYVGQHGNHARVSRLSFAGEVTPVLVFEFNGLHPRLSPNGKLVLLPGYDGRVELGEVETGKKLASIQRDSEDLTDAQFIDNGEKISVGSHRNRPGESQVYSTADLLKSAAQP